MTREEFLRLHSKAAIESGRRVRLGGDRHEALGVGIFAILGPPKIEFYEFGLRYTGEGERTVRYEEIVEPMGMDLRQLMLAAKRPQEPVKHQISTLHGAVHLEQHLYDYTSLISFLGWARRPWRAADG